MTIRRHHRPTTGQLIRLTGPTWTTKLQNETEAASTAALFNNPIEVCSHVLLLGQLTITPASASASATTVGVDYHHEEDEERRATHVYPLPSIHHLTVACLLLKPVPPATLSTRQGTHMMMSL